MAVYSVTGYYNTGFDAINVPDSPSLVRSATSRTFPSNWLLQNKDLTHTRLNATWDEVADIDYVAIGSTFYFVTNIEMLTETCADLSLQIDAISTAGGISALTFTGGMCERAHASSDGLFANNLAEPITPTTDLEIDGYRTFHTSSDGFTTIVVSTIQLQDIDTLADEYKDSNGNIVCYVPKVPPVEDTSTALMPLPVLGSKTQKLPNVALYQFEAFKEQIQQVRSLGLDTAITGCYALPYEWGQLNAGTNVTGMKYQNGTGISYRYASASNNKVFSMFNTYTLVAMATGNKVTAEAHEIYGNDSAPSIVMYSDPAPNGKPYGQFTYYERNTQAPFANAVAGGAWLNTPIVYGNASGSLIQQTQFSKEMRFASKSQNVNAGLAGIGNAISMLGNIASLNVGGVLSTGMNELANEIRYDLQTEQRDMQKAEFATEQAIRVPDVTFPQEPTIQGYIGNGFLVYRTRLSSADVARFDKFFTMFGYAQSKALEKSDFTNRAYFNYVQAKGVSVKCSKGLRIRNQIAQQLSNGVRIWHVMPSASYYSNNPIG